MARIVVALARNNVALQRAARRQHGRATPLNVQIAHETGCTELLVPYAASLTQAHISCNTGVCAGVHERDLGVGGRSQPVLLHEGQIHSASGVLCSGCLPPSPIRRPLGRCHGLRTWDAAGGSVLGRWSALTHTELSPCGRSIDGRCGGSTMLARRCVRSPTPFSTMRSIRRFLAPDRI